MSLKMIVMDCDGTLLNEQKNIDVKTYNALMACQETGIRLVLASGRPHAGLMRYARQLELDKYGGYLIAYNGAQVFDCTNNIIVKNQVIEPTVLTELLQHLGKFNVRIMLDNEDIMFVEDVFDGIISYRGKPFNVIEYEARGGGYRLCEVDSFSKGVDFPVNKVLTAASNDYLVQHEKAMSEPFQESLNCMFTGDFYYEYTAKDVDKACALKTVIEDANISFNQVMAIGDSYNDLTMLEVAGVSVAMGNAVDAVKTCATFVTLDNNQAGIAHAIDQFILNND